MFSSVRAPRVSEHIIGQIEAAIFGARLRSGDKLPPERELVRQFRASRVAVREALRSLAQRGLIEVRHGASGGHFVREFDTGLLRRDFETLLRLRRISVPQLTEARLLIEPEIAALAALRATDVDQKSLVATVDGRRELIAGGVAPRELDVEFHRLVAGASHNPVHTILTDALMTLETSAVLPRIELSADDNVAIDLAHRAIITAIAGRRPDDARTAMAAHIVDVERRFGRRVTDTPGGTWGARRAAPHAS
ncbi:MAG: FadR family transcriptional regulator [Candidatus Rokubacteria bacterium]|nr:FadR family transcriptional regulator [Candidatus Rokubacteria bacterium]